MPKGLKRKLDAEADGPRLIPARFKAYHFVAPSCITMPHETLLR
jgi:hypothetical protein